MAAFKNFLLERGWISVVAFAASLLFSFVLFPHLVSRAFLPLDIDGHGQLGWGIYTCRAFSFYPICEPTLIRAPFYPFILFGVIASNPAWYPYSAIIFQCLLFACLVQGVFSIVRSFASVFCAQMIALACALHPYLLWYMSRIWTEPLLAFLFTFLSLGLIIFARKPGLLKALGVGVLLGICCLTKQTFLPFIAIIPIGLFYLKFKKEQAFAIAIAAILMIAPWTIRNWILTHHLIPVHLLVGYNMQIGDYLIDHPYSKDWWTKANRTRIDPVEAESYKQIDKDAPLWQRELYIEKKTMLESLSRYLNDPYFFLRKILFNAMAFWFLGGINSFNFLSFYLIFIILQGITLLFFILACYRIWVYQGRSSIHSLIVLLVWFYFLFHLPILSESRFSLPLLPTMLAYGFGWPKKLG